MKAHDENVTIAPDEPFVNEAFQWGLFWATVALSAILSLVGTMGNAMVIFVGGRRKKTGVLRHFNNAVRSLAITDFLIGAVGMPAIIVFSYLG